MAQTVNFQIYQGTDFDDVVILREEDGTPVDLTGAVAYLQARRDIADATPVYDWSSTGGHISLGDAAGTVSFVVTEAQTAAPSIDPDGEALIYDLLIQFGDGETDRVLAGLLNVFPCSTRIP